MNARPVHVRCSWECRFCHKEGTTHGITPVNGPVETPPPEQWRIVTLFGETRSDVTPFSGYQAEREVLLCPECTRVYYKYVGEMTRFATDFWWSRVRFIACGEGPREVKLPWADEDRKKDPRNWSD